MRMPIMYLDSIMSAGKPANRKLNKPRLLTRIDICKNIVTVIYEVYEANTAVKIDLVSENHDFQEIIDECIKEKKGSYKITWRILETYLPGNYKVRLHLNNEIIRECDYQVSPGKYNMN